MGAVLAGETPAATLVARAFAAPHALWQRALVIEACGAQFNRALRLSSVAGITPPALRRELSDATAQAIRRALRVPGQIAELAQGARECGIRFMVLKGAARLLGGAVAGGRSLSDIDVLAAPDDARRLHVMLRHRLGYDSMSAAPEHHLPTLSRAGALPVEVHVQLGPRVTHLDARIWRDVQEVQGAGIIVPSPTAALMHALEHGALVHWAVRYRLRDLLDVAEAWTAGVDAEEVVNYLRAHPQRVALETLLGAARRFGVAIPAGRRSAWRTVRRVARARYVLAAHVRDPARATSLCIAAGVLAEASPRALFRPARLALFGVKQARIDLRLPMLGRTPHDALATAKVREKHYR
jgi:putative nucleotidyltransferase-like protein